MLNLPIKSSPGPHITVQVRAKGKYYVLHWRRPIMISQTASRMEKKIRFLRTKIHKREMAIANVLDGGRIEVETPEH
jgi:hypothetical protein